MAGGNTGNLDKKQLTEADIRTKFITPAIISSNWDLMTQIAASRATASDLLQAIVSELTTA